jgi:hypothetical protein
MSIKQPPMMRPNQKEKRSVIPYPSSLPKIMAIKKRTNSARDTMKKRNLKWSQWGFDSFSNG